MFYDEQVVFLNNKSHFSKRKINNKMREIFATYMTSNSKIQPYKHHQEEENTRGYWHRTQFTKKKYKYW